MMNLLFVLALVLLCDQCRSGSIYKVNDGIRMSVSNQGEVGWYKFNIKAQNKLVSSSTSILSIVFPSEYGIGIVQSGVIQCSVGCSVVGDRQVDLVMSSDLLAMTEYEFRIDNVLNPSSSGGTGNFQIKSMRGGQIIDENLIFTSIGISRSIEPLSSATVSYQSGQSRQAGQTTILQFSFKVNSLIPKETYFVFQLGMIGSQGFGVALFPSCKQFSINNWKISGELVCRYDGDKGVIVNGLSEDVSEGSNIGVAVSVSNPALSGHSSAFAVSLKRVNTTSIRAQNTNIGTIQVTPGPLTSLSLRPTLPTALQSKGKEQLYLLQFIPSNQLSLTSCITIKPPGNFQVVVNDGQLVQIEGGLVNKDENNPVSVVIGGGGMTISNYQIVQGGSLIRVLMRLLNPPSSSGLTSPIQIMTYQDTLKTLLVDADILLASTTILNLPSPLVLHKVVIVDPTCNGLTTDFSFPVQPSVDYPINHQLRILVDTQLTIAGICQCQLGSTLLSCSYTDNLIIIDNPNRLSVSSLSTFKVSSCIIKPQYSVSSGQYPFDLTISLAGVSLESFTVFGLLTARHFISFSYSLLGNYPLYPSILRVAFTTTQMLPSGAPQTSSDSIQGQIMFRFPTEYGNLKQGLTHLQAMTCDCLAGLIPIPESTIICQYRLDNGIPWLIIKNFQSIPSDTRVSVQIPLKNAVVGSYELTVFMGYEKNNVKTYVNEQKATLLIEESSTISPNVISDLNGRQYSPTNAFVSSQFSVFFRTHTSNEADDYLLIKLPSFDTGFLPAPDRVICEYATGSSFTSYTPINYSCHSFIPDQLILIQIKQQVIKEQNIPFIHLKDLLWPSYSYAPTSPALNIYLIRKVGSVYRTIEQNQLPAFVIPQPKPFLFVQAIIPRQTKDDVNINIKLKFQQPDALAKGSKVAVRLPVGYELDPKSSNADRINPRVTFPQFRSETVGSDLVIDISSDGRTATTQGLAAFPAKGVFTVIFEGLKTPNQVQQTDFTITSLFSTYTINQQTSFMTIDYQIKQNSYVYFIRMNAWPLNAGLVSVTSLVFQPSRPIPIGGLIEITFPSEYSLPSAVECSVSLALQSFASITLSGNTYSITTNSVYNSGSIQVELAGITNPSVGTTSGFLISTKYDQMQMDFTDTSSLAKRVLTMVGPAVSLVVNTFTFWPTNEGQLAIYSLDITLPNGFSSSDSIVLTFPNYFDALLGENVQVASGLIGNLALEIKERKLSISKVSGSGRCVLTISNIINPQRQSSYKFVEVAVVGADGQTYKANNDNSIKPQFTAPPEWLPMTALLLGHHYARQPNTFTYHLEVGSLPSNANYGQLWLDFPSEFYLENSEVKVSSALGQQQTPDRVGNRLIVAGGSGDLSNVQLEVAAENTPNPDLNITASPFLAMIYNTQTQQVLSRSYHNLDPFSFDFTYRGPLITVNNNTDIYVRSGTFSAPIALTLLYPIGGDLLLQVECKDNAKIKVKDVQYRLSNMTVLFRVEVDALVEEGNYYLIWSASGATQEPLYTPVKKTKVIVNRAGQVDIKISQLFPVMQGGSSLPLVFTLPYGAHSGVTIELSLSPSTSLSLSAQQLVFLAGQTTSTLSLQSQGVSPLLSNLEMTLSGVQASIYRLPTASLSFNIMPKGNSRPFVLDLIVSPIGYNTASIIIGTDTLCEVFYMLALAGTPTQSYQDVVDQTPGPLTQLRFYGSTMVDMSNRVVFPLNHLIANTTYSLTVYAINRDQLETVAPKTVQFSTKPNPPAADFAVRFRQTYLNSQEKLNVITRILAVLSLEPSKLQEQKYFFGLSAPSASDSTYFTLRLQVSSHPLCSNYPPPVDLVNLLNTRKKELLTLPNFDLTFTITPSPFVPYKPDFISKPVITAVGKWSCTVTLILDNYGRVYATPLKVKDIKAKPTAYQIYKGFSEYNIQQPSANLEVSLKFTPYTLTVSNLSPDTEYNLYLIAGSVHPSYPDLQIDSKQQVISFKTLPIPVIVRLVIISAQSLLFSTYCLILLILLANL